MKKYLESVSLLLSGEPDPAYARRAAFILNNIDLKKGQKLLEVGCGRGFYMKTMSGLFVESYLTGIDLNKKYVMEAEQNLKEAKNVDILKADATKLPFRDNYFDVILASEVLEHIPDDNKALLEMKRVLKPQGKVIITVPNQNYPFLWDPINWFLEKVFKTHIPSNIWWLAGIWADHQRLYSDDDMERVIKKSNLHKNVGSHMTTYSIPFCHFIMYGVGKNIVEMGGARGFNRFKSRSNGPSFLNKLLLFPIRLIDKMNRHVDRNPCVNLGYILTKDK